MCSSEYCKAQEWVLQHYEQNPLIWAFVKWVSPYYLLYRDNLMATTLIILNVVFTKYTFSSKSLIA